VLETPLDRVDSFLTPLELFYVPSHSPAPKIEPASYRLQIDGAVRSPLSLTLQGIARHAGRDACRHFGVRRQ
jgi:sulfite oxidase